MSDRFRGADHEGDGGPRPKRDMPVPALGEGLGPMRSLLVQGELSPSDLTGAFDSIGAERQGTSAYTLGNVRVLQLVGRKFFFRSNDYLGLVLLAATDGVSQRIDIGYAGGGSGLLGIQWGAGDKLEGSLFDALTQALQARSLPYQDATASPSDANQPLR
jgi:hypothetical protein